MEQKIRFDLSFIKEQANSNSNRYKDLKKRILRIPSREFDELLIPLAKQISAAIDCTQCGNCCKTLNPPVRDDEISRLADRKKCSAEEFSKDYLHKNTDQPFFFFKRKPCIFLNETHCSIYESRPDSCADYPHLFSSGQKFRFGRTVDQSSICPIVFYVIEEIENKLSQ